MCEFFKLNINQQYEFILFNKDDGKYYRTNKSTNNNQYFELINHKIMEGKGFSSYNDYLKTKAKAYKAEQHNRKSINNLNFLVQHY